MIATDMSITKTTLFDAIFADRFPASGTFFNMGIRSDLAAFLA